MYAYSAMDTASLAKTGRSMHRHQPLLLAMNEDASAESSRPQFTAPKIRTEFPETWIWPETLISAKYVFVFLGENLLRTITRRKL